MNIDEKSGLPVDFLYEIKQLCEENDFRSYFQITPNRFSGQGNPQSMFGLKCFLSSISSHQTQNHLTEYPLDYVFAWTNDRDVSLSLIKTYLADIELIMHYCSSDANQVVWLG